MSGFSEYFFRLGIQKKFYQIYGLDCRKEYHPYGQAYKAVCTVFHGVLNCYENLKIHQRLVLKLLIYESKHPNMGAQWLSGTMLDSRLRGCGFQPHRHHCLVSLSKNIISSLVLVQPRKTHPFINERLLMGHKESNQTKQPNKMRVRPAKTQISLGICPV